LHDSGVMKRALFPALAPALLGALAGCAPTYSDGVVTFRPGPPQETGPVDPVTVGVIALNDFHGQLEPPRRTVTLPVPGGEPVDIPAGGAAWLASAVEGARAKYQYSLTVAAGDLTGASQLSSALFLDEPAVGVMNRIGLDFNAVGNHEFDRGWQELVRLQMGGCEQHTAREPCAVEPAFGGAQYRYLAANVELEDGSTLFPASALRHFGEGRSRVAIGVIGLTLRATPTVVSASGVEGLKFTDEAEAINKAAATLRLAGADAVIVLIHQGLDIGGERDPNGCDRATGDLLPIIAQLKSEVDLIVSGHTHQAYVCDLPSADGAKTLLVTSAGSYGTVVTDIRLTIDPVAGRVLALQARNAPVQSVAYGNVTPSNVAPVIEPRADVADYVATYVAAAAEFSARPAGKLIPVADQATLPRAPFGQLIADAQLEATRGAGAQFALMNPGGVRGVLIPKPDNTLTFGDLFQVQPFGNTLVTMTLSGAELLQLLESQVDDEGLTTVMLPSAGLAYNFDKTRPSGARVMGVTLDGAPIDPAKDYRFTVNGFLADGGDGFTPLRQGRDRVVGGVDLDALEAYLKANPPRTMPVAYRAKDVTPGS
jgi:5'-nucleotidase